MGFTRDWALRLIACVAIACSDGRASTDSAARGEDAACTAERNAGRGAGAQDASEDEPDASRTGPSVTPSETDAALSGRDAAPAATDAAPPSDDCDRDGDGVARDARDCPLAAGQEPDCDDSDARVFPGAPPTCRDTHFAGCSRDRVLAESLGVEEARIATIDLGPGGSSHRLSATAVSGRMFGRAAGLVAHPHPSGELHITSVPETLVDALPGERHSIPWVEAVSMQTEIAAVTLGRAGNDPVLAVVDRRPSARLFSLAGLPTRELVSVSATSALLPVAGIVDTAGEPTLVTAATDETGVTHLRFASAPASREVLVDTPRGVEPWLSVGRDRVLWGFEGSTYVETVEVGGADVATRHTLTAAVTGAGALVTRRFGSEHFALVPTLAGLESFREPCVAGGDCQSVAHPELADALGLRPRIEAAEVSTLVDLVALTVVDTVRRAAHLYFIRASDPGHVLLDLDLKGPDDAEVRDVALGVTDRYGGTFLLVTTRDWSGALRATGVTLCDLL